MKIKEITWQYRRDFRAIYICEYCGDEYEGAGYDDAYFHSEVIPQMVCIKCGKGVHISYRPLTTKYPEGYQI